MTTAIQQDFGIDSRFSVVGPFVKGSAENMSESSDSSTSSHTNGIAAAEENHENETAKNEDDPSHVYTNIREIEELNNRPIPPTPSINAKPRRDLLNGWFEYETDVGRTFFYNRETGKSQWIPPRFIRTPAQVAAFLRATRTELDETCTFEGTSSHISSEKLEEKKEVEKEAEKEVEDEEIFDEVCEEQEEEEGNNFKAIPEERPVHSPDTDFSDDFELSDEESFQTEKKECSMPHPYPETVIKNLGQSQEEVRNAQPAPYMIPPDAIRTPISNISLKMKHQSPTSHRSLSFQNKCSKVMRNVSMTPQTIPTCSATLDRTPDRGIYGFEDSENEHRLLKCQERRGSVESREPVRTIRCGDMERCEHREDLVNKVKKKEWLTNYMYLTSAHLILYKDQKSAEKHGKHYDAPMGVWDLRGAKISWFSEKESKKKKKYILLELCNEKKYLLRSTNDIDEWYRVLEEVVGKLPAPSSTNQSVIDVGTSSVVRNPSYLGSTRPLSHALIPIRSIRQRNDPMSQSAIECSSTSAVVEESRPSKETILEKLKRFFRTRPTVESLKEKGIYKPEPVFGSTLAIICQIENSLVPKFILVVTDVIEKKGLETDGIYRVSGNLSAVQKIRCQADQDDYKALVAEEDIHVLTGALKLFFRELSEPLFPTALHKEYTSAMQNPNSPVRFRKFEELLTRLPNENRETLKVLLRHLNRVASHSSQNRMQQHNLAIVFGPTLFHNGDGAGLIPKNKKGAKKGKVKGKDESQPVPIQSNSHMAFNMIMQSQIVQYLLESANKFEILKAPINLGR